MLQLTLLTFGLYLPVFIEACFILAAISDSKFLFISLAPNLRGWNGAPLPLQSLVLSPKDPSRTGKDAPLGI